MVGDVDYRQALGRFPTGVTVVTVADGDQRFAMTASALTSVSLDPILLLVCFGHETSTGEAVRRAGLFGLSLLGEDDGDVARALAVHSDASSDQLADFDVRDGPCGVPLLTGAIAHIVCAVERVVSAGDHDVVVGEVEWIESDLGEIGPLVYYDERFLTLAPFGDEQQSRPA